jgi:hypothetical protein
MKHIEQVPSMTVIHLIAIKDNRIFDLKRKVEEMQKTLEEAKRHLSNDNAGYAEYIINQYLKEDKPNGNSTTV